MEGGRVTVWVGLVAACVLLLGSAAFGDLFAVAKPTTQTVPINGTAAEFDGLDSYAEDPPCPVTDWAWDFDPSTVLRWTSTSSVEP